MLGLLGFSLFFVACPEPIDKASDGSTNNAGTNSQQANINATTPEGAPVKTDGGAPPMKGTFPANASAAENTPKYTQEELSSSEGVIKGYVKCDDCGHQILIRALPAPPKDGEPSTGDGAVQLITSTILSEVGEFTIRVPNKTWVVLQVVDSRPTTGGP